MSMFTKITLSLFLSTCVWINFAYTQTSTYEEVYNIMQTKCTGCHGGAAPQGALDLSGSMTEVYDVLVGKTPTNPAAAAKGYKQVAPGYVENSYLLNKLATPEWDDTFPLEVAEGNLMPPAPLDPLTSKEIELFRQWILFGAPKDEQVVEPEVLEDYYENGMALLGTDVIAAPDPSEGFQIRLGPFFLKPGEEREFFKKHDMGLDIDTEVNRIDLSFNDESHHFILYKMGENIAGNVRDGMRDIQEAEFAMVSNTLVSAWQNEHSHILPEGAAYRFKDDTYLDLNYHLKNYSAVGILAAEVYINVYTQTIGTAKHEMFSTLLPYDIFDLFTGGSLGDNLIIPNNGDLITFTDYVWVPDLPFVPFHPGTWHIWQLSTHTHARGTDYDIYLANPDGSKGEQIYEGFYNFGYTFNQGYFDYEHPPIRTFDPLLPIDMGLGGGIVHEAKFINNEADTLGWGDTTDDEMMLLFVHFTTEALTTDVEDAVETPTKLGVFPNPVSAQTTISYELKDRAQVALQVFDVLGKKVSEIVNTNQTAGDYNHTFDTAKAGLSNGIYLVQLTIDGEIAASEKVMVSR